MRADLVSLPFMQGVTTAIVAFVFVCIVFPHLVKNRTQFYAAFFFALAVVLLDSVANIWDERAAFRVFAYAMCGLFQVAAIILLFLSAGGITWRELGGEMARAIEVIRRGEEEKEILIPLGGQKPKPKPPGGRDDEDQPRPRIELADPAAAEAEKKPADEDPGLPLT